MIAALVILIVAAGLGVLGFLSWCLWKLLEAFA